MESDIPHGISGLVGQATTLSESEACSGFNAKYAKYAKVAIRKEYFTAEVAEYAEGIIQEEGAKRMLRSGARIGLSARPSYGLKTLSESVTVIVFQREGRKGRNMILAGAGSRIATSYRERGSARPQAGHPGCMSFSECVTVIVFQRNRHEADLSSFLNRN